MSQTVLLGDKVIAHLTSSCATSLNGELSAIACGQLEAFPWLHIVAVGNLSLNPQVCFICTENQKKKTSHQSQTSEGFLSMQPSFSYRYSWLRGFSSNLFGQTVRSWN